VNAGSVLHNNYVIKDGLEEDITLLC